MPYVLRPPRLEQLFDILGWSAQHGPIATHNDRPLNQIRVFHNEEQGLHIALPAAAIKVSPRKLDALENDRYEELPDATFARALAQTMCRALKIDPHPVLARLPQVRDSGLDMAGSGLNMPFRDRPVRSDSSLGGWPQRPLLWAGVVLLLAAAGIALVPTGIWRVLGSDAGTAEPQPAASAPPSGPAVASAAAGPAAVPATAEASAAGVAAAGCSKALS